MLSEIALIFAAKMDPTYRKLFFDKFMDRFVTDLRYLDDDTLYKMVWTFIRADRFQKDEDAMHWYRIRELLIDKSAEIDPRVLTNLLVLSTKVKNFDEKTTKNTGSDLWDAFEPRLVLKLDSMQLEDLVNLLWSSLRVNKGTRAFYEELEKAIRKRVYKFKDEEFETLIGCVTND